MKYLLVTLLLAIQVTACNADKPISNVLQEVVINQSVKTDLIPDECEKRLISNINALAFNFISIGEGVFISDSEGWKANIQCLQNQVLFNIQGKKTLNRIEDQLTEVKANEHAKKLKISIEEILKN